MKWQVNPLCKLKTDKINDISCCYFQCHITHKTAKSLANLTSQSCGDLKPAVCLSREDAAIQRAPEHLWMSNKPQKQARAKAA